MGSGQEEVDAEAQRRKEESADFTDYAERKSSSREDAKGKRKAGGREFADDGDYLEGGERRHEQRR